MSYILRIILTSRSLCRYIVVTRVATLISNLREIHFIHTSLLLLYYYNCTIMRGVRRACIFAEMSLVALELFQEYK